MRKATILFVLVSFFSLYGVSQSKRDIQKMPKVELPMNGDLIEFSISFTTMLPDSIVYKRAKHWYENGMVESMRIEESELVAKEKIVGKAEMPLLGPSDKKGNQPSMGRIRYTMTTKIEGSKCTAYIQNLNQKDVKYVPVEPWLKSQDEDYMHKYYLMYMEEQAESIFASFKEFVDVEMRR